MSFYFAPAQTLTWASRQHSRAEPQTTPVKARGEAPSPAGGETEAQRGPGDGATPPLRSQPGALPTTLASNPFPH